MAVDVKTINEGFLKGSYYLLGAYIITVTIMQTVAYARLHTKVQAGNNSAAICGYEYSEAETGRGKALEFMTVPNKGLNLIRGTVYATAIVWILYVTLLVAGFIAHMIITRADYTINNHVPIVCIVLTVVVWAVYFSTYIVYIIVGKKDKGSPLQRDLGTKTPTEMIKYIKAANKTVAGFYLSAVLFVGMSLYKRVLDSPIIITQTPHIAIAVITYLAFFGLTYYIYNNYMRTLDTIVIRNKATSRFNANDTLRTYADELYRLAKGDSEYSSTEYMTFKDTASKYLIRNIKTLDYPIDGDDTLNMDERYIEGTIWKYVFHNDGRELQSLFEECKRYAASLTPVVPETGVTEAPEANTKQTNSALKTLKIKEIPENCDSVRVDALNKVAQLVINLRLRLARLRRDASIPEMCRVKFNQTLVIALIFSTAVAYPLFHQAYMTSATRTTFASAIAIVIMVFISSITGMMYGARGL